MGMAIRPWVLSKPCLRDQDKIKNINFIKFQVFNAAFISRINVAFFAYKKIFIFRV